MASRTNVVVAPVIQGGMHGTFLRREGVGIGLRTFSIGSEFRNSLLLSPRLGDLVCSFQTGRTRRSILLLQASSLRSPSRLPTHCATPYAKTRKLTSKPFGVNITLLPSINPPDYAGYARAAVEEGVRIFETAGNNRACSHCPRMTGTDWWCNQRAALSSI